MERKKPSTPYYTVATAKYGHKVSGGRNYEITEKNVSSCSRSSQFHTAYERRNEENYRLNRGNK